MAEKWKCLDEHLRLRLADLEPGQFERFFLHFLRADISLTIERNGQKITRRVIEAQIYNAGSGREQKGIDVLVRVEGGETWVFQCKRHKTWSVAQTRTAIQKAAQYQANHHFLVVACDPSEGVQDEMEKHPDWTFWNLDTICAEFRLRVPPSKRTDVLFFLSPEELKRFAPSTTEALIPPGKFFEKFLGEDKTFRHDWKLVGRQKELQALQNFVDGPHIVQIVCAKGGEGKSRLLRELCGVLEKSEIEVLCLNPVRLNDDPEFAFAGDPSRRVILVDDAHRVEQVPTWLFGLVAEDAKKRSSKIILATRPQGVDALSHKLYETGLAEKVAPQVSIAKLKKSQIKALAVEAIGEKIAGFADELARLTSDSPFLTVVAGDLLRRGRLHWGKWASDQEFRRQVFWEFEQKNLEAIPEADRDKAKGLLRFVAMLAPVKVDQQFNEAAPGCLGLDVFQFETLLNRLRQSELVAGGEDGLRVIPDLFADSLVYDVCYEPKQRMPAFVGKIFEKFSEHNAALLRNLSETTWIARANGVSDDILKPLVEREYHRFKEATDFQRGDILGQWSRFSVFLPVESLELANLAVRLNSHPDESIRAQISTLLKPIAKYHGQHRHEALSLLWKLGWPDALSNSGFGQDHPWAVISEVIKYEPKKPIEVTLDVLDWLDAQLRKPESQKVLEGKTPVLRMLVGPCFDRIVEWSWWEGRQCHFCRQCVSAKITMGIRDRALSILAWTIENGSWLAALDALSALETAIERIYPLQTSNPSELAKTNEEWLPERLKALALFEMAVKRHAQLAVRYKVRQTLKRKVVREKDPSFAAEARRVIGCIPDDLALRTAVALVSRGADEIEDRTSSTWTEDDLKRVTSLWDEKVRGIAVELAASVPVPEELQSFLKKLTEELAQSGYHPWPVTLFEGLAQAAPDIALGLAQEIIDATAASPLSLAWPALVEKNADVDDAKQLELFQKAAHASLAGASSAAVRALALKSRQEQPLSEAAKKLLIEIATRANDEEAGNLLQLVEWCSDSNVTLATRILKALPIRRIAPKMLARILEALYPIRERKLPFPAEVVRGTVSQLDTVSDLGTFDDLQAWETLIQQHPRAVYELLCKRIARAASGAAGNSFSPIPFDFHCRICLPDLQKEPDYAEICDDLWERVCAPYTSQRFCWEKLFHAVVLPNPSFWLGRLLRDIETVESAEKLLRLVELLSFDGSLLIFRFPDLSRAFLKKAQSLGGKDFFNVVRSGLYHGCGPQGRAYSNGILDANLDYVEAEAVKAAEGHAADELLGPFYRWIVEIEQKDRLMHKMVSETELAASD
jgi:hypothetical protein